MYKTLHGFENLVRSMLMKIFLIDSLQIISITLIIPVFLSANLYAQVGFSEVIIDDNFDRVAAVVAADIDGDGYKDVIGAAVDANEVAWWRNDGSSPINWTKYSVDDQFGGAIWVHCIDINGDSLMDIVACAVDDNELAWYRNNGGMPVTWTKQVIQNDFTQAHGAFACDMDQDGDVDVLGAALELHQIAWWRNDGGDPIDWTRQIISSSVGGVRAVAAADADGDGDMDVFGAGFVQGVIKWWRNDGNDPIEWTELLVDNLFNGAHHLHLCDMDADGDSDVVAAAFSINQVAWWRNNGGDPVSWEKEVIESYFGGALNVHAGDFDLDGDIDVVASAWGNNDIAWWANPGDEPSNWTRHLLDNNYLGAWPVYASDLDGDGDNDIISGADAANDVTFWKNQLYNFGFSAEPLTGHAPLSVQFMDTSTSPWTITDWAWDFENDGEFDSFVQNPLHNYDEPGVYSVTMQVAGDNESHTLTCENLIHVFPGYSAVRFDGADSYIMCDPSPSLNITDQITFEAWIKPYGWGSDLTMGLSRICDKDAFSIFLIKTSTLFSDHSLVFYQHSDEGPSYMSNTPENSISLDIWQHIAVTYDCNDNVKIYVDGIEQTLWQTAPPARPLADHGQVPLYLGSNTDCGRNYDGVIDEVRIWSLVRSESEIQDNLDNYLTGNEPGLAGYWKMDEGSGSEVSDYSPNENHAGAYFASWAEGVSLGPVWIGSHQSPENVPTGIIARAFPNPSNSSFLIRYTLPAAVAVEVAIFDLLGRKITTVDSGFKTGGDYIVRWQPADLASGLYFYYIQGNNWAFKDKIILLK